MKDNQDLQFAPLYGTDGRTDSMASGDGGGSLTMTATIGCRDQAYRVYGSLYHHDQDASREGNRGECVARGNSATEALTRWCDAAAKLGWRDEGIEEIRQEMSEEIAELDLPE